VSDGLPTARTTLRAGYVRVLVFCNSCRHQADADLQALIDAGRGDVPLVDLRFRCGNCRSKLTDFVCTSRSGPLVKALACGPRRLCAMLGTAEAAEPCHQPRSNGGWRVNQIIAAETVIPIAFGCVFLLLIIGFACMYTTP
jgi:hypothetical protein